MAGQAETELAARQCVPCKGGEAPLKGDALAALSEMVPGWQVLEEHHLARDYKFADFAEALDFVNRVGELAEKAGHHPWIHFTWGKVRIEIWTHKVDGLSESDFILAARIDGLEP
jgi:4a-hydroxytetrahydrobiopterin dehydratase